MPAPTIGPQPGTMRTTSIQNLPIASGNQGRSAQGPPPTLVNGNRINGTGFQPRNSVVDDQGFYQVTTTKKHNKK